MTVPSRRPPGRPPIYNDRLGGRVGTARARLPQSGGSYSIHPLVALDGVCLYVLRAGEPVGFYFGVTARGATAAAAEDLFGAVTHDGPTA